MNDVISKLERRLDELASSAHANRDIESVRAGKPQTSAIAARTRHANRRRFAVQVAAGAVLVAGVGGLIAISASDDEPVAQAPPETQPAVRALPVMPGSQQGTQLLVECLVRNGLDVHYDNSTDQPGIEFDNSVVDVTTYDTTYSSCNEQLVLSGQIYGLGPDAPTGPGIAVVPGSNEGMRLLGDCLLASGLDVEIDGAGISFDNRVVSNEQYNEHFDSCFDSLVAAGKIVPLPSN